MTLEATIATIIDEANPVVRDALRQIARRAYEAGFREALAQRGPVPPAVVSAPVVAIPYAPAGKTQVSFAESEDDFEPEAAPEQSAPAPVDFAALPDDEPDPVDAPGGLTPAEGRRSRPEPQPVRLNLTVGSLRTRIIRHFGLERFDIDVLVCKKDDPKRRQLRGDAELRRYLVGEGKR